MSHEKKKVALQTQSVLGKYFCNRTHAVKEDLDSFTAFLVHLKYQYRDRVEIPRTVIKLLHMYHPQDGYEAYMKLVKVICVLLEELDQDILKYLLSIIPPPNIQSSQNMETMKEEIQQVAGFTLLSTPAFHTWVLPVLNNTPCAPQQEINSEVKPLKMLRTHDLLEDKKPVETVNSSHIVESHETKSNLNSDSDSVIAEPKLEDYDLYEIVGDLSKTILNQLSSKPNSKKSPYKHMKEMFDLESLMAPSAVKTFKLSELPNHLEEDQTVKGYGLTSEIKKHIGDLSVDPALENSVKNFIARACGLLPSTTPENINDKKQVRRNTVKKPKLKKSRSFTLKERKTTLPKPKKSLIDELSCPQKKPLLSYLISPLDPVPDIVEHTRETNQMQLKEESLHINNVAENYVPDTENKFECKKLLGIDKKKRKKAYNKKSHKSCGKKSKSPKKSKLVHDTEYIMHDPSSSLRERGSLTATPTLPELLPSIPDLIPSIEEEEKLMPLEVTDDLSMSVDAVLSDQNKATVNANCDSNLAEETILKEVQSSSMKQEYDSNPIIIDFPSKNLDLEWNMENIKLFGINMPSDMCDKAEVEKDKSLDTERNEISSVIKKPETSSHEPSIPEAHGFSSYNSHTSTEYLSYLHDLAVAKCTEQHRENSVVISNSTNSEAIERSEKNKDTCKASETSISPVIPSLKQEKPPVTTNLLPQLSSQRSVAEISSNQTANMPAETSRLWTEYPSTYDSHHPVNLQRQDSLSINLHNNTTRLRQFECIRNTQLGPLLSSIPRSNNNANVIGNTSTLCGVNPSYEAVPNYQALPNSHDWITKQPTGSNQQLQHHPWGAITGYEQYPVFRELAQRRERLVQRAAYLQHTATPINNYLDPAHTLMMNGLWGSFGSVRHGLYARTNEAPTLLPGVSQSMFPVNDPIRHQRLRTMTPGIYPNYTTPPASVVATVPPPQTKRRKLEEIVGRLKEAEKIT